MQISLLILMLVAGQDPDASPPMAQFADLAETSADLPAANKLSTLKSHSTAAPSASPPYCPRPPSTGHAGHLAECWNYHRKVCRGAYVRPLYNYRIDFDYLWPAGPSQQFWPIAPPSTPEFVTWSVPVLPPRLPCPPDVFLEPVQVKSPSKSAVGSTLRFKRREDTSDSHSAMPQPPRLR